MPSHRAHFAHALLFAVTGASLTALGCSATDAGTSAQTPAAVADGGATQTAAVVSPFATRPGRAEKVARMKVARDGHTATLLPNGKVLVIGGERISSRAQLASVELYDPDTNAWTSLASLPKPRGAHTATLLASGKVLVVGGGVLNAIGVPSGEEVHQDALLVDPETGEAKPVGAPRAARHGHQAALLPSGKVLLVGGGGSGSTPKEAKGAGGVIPFATALADAEVFDPASETFTSVGPMAEARYAFTLVALADGRVVAAGGAGDGDPESLATAEVFDETKGTFAPAGEFKGADRLHHAATRLADGRVLVFGGKKANRFMLQDTQIWDPTSGQWTLGPTAGPARTVATLVPLQEGGALVFGGLSCDNDGCTAPTSVQVWSDKGATRVFELSEARSLATATVLKDGSTLIVGGYGATGDSLTSAERLMP